MNKKMRILSLLLTALMVISLSACGSADNRVEDGAKQDNSVANEQSTDEDTAEASTTVTPAQAEDQVSAPESGRENSDILVVYFSRTGEQYTVGVIDKGNTAVVAEMISEETGADLFELIPEDDHYPMTYSELTDVAKQEQNDNARPAYANG